MSEITLQSTTSDIRAWADTIEAMEDGALDREQALLEQARAILRSQDHVESFGKFIQRCSLEDEFLKSEQERLGKRRRAIQACEARLRDYAVRVMQENTFLTLYGRTITLKLASNPPSIEITDETSIPAEYRRLTIEISKRDWDALCEAAGYSDSGLTGGVLKGEYIDKRAIKAALESEAVPGADLSIGKQSLRVR